MRISFNYSARISNKLSKVRTYYINVHRLIDYYFNRLWDCPERGSSKPGLRSIATPVHPITARRSKPSDWQLEGEETLKNNIRGPQERR